MGYSYESEFVFIGRGDDSFLENYSYELSDDPDGAGGKIFMSLEILNNQAEAEDIGEAIFANFKQKFYERTDQDPYKRFEESLKEVNIIIETLKEEKVSRFIGNLNVAIGAIVDGTLYITTTGDAEVYLVRKRFVSIVSEGLAEESQKEMFVNIANGTLESGDSVLFSSTRLLRYITKNELGKIFSGVGPQRMGEALSGLQDFIMTEILGKSAVIGIAIAETEEAGAGEEDVFDAPGEGRISALLKKLMPSLSALPSLAGKFDWLKKLMPEVKNPGLPKIKFPARMSRERILVIVTVLLVVLVGGVFWIRTRGNQDRIIAEEQAKLNHVQELMSEASTVGQFDKAKAAELLNSGEQETLTVLNSRYLRGEAVKVMDDIQKSRDALDDVRRIDQPTLLADLSQKRSTVSALGMLSLKDKFYAFEYNALYEMVLDKLQEPLTINDVETVILGVSYADQNSLLFLTRTGKMIEYAGGRFSFIATKDGIWKKGVDMKSYNDRLYILDKDRNQIWRYIRRRDGFDTGEAYNQDGDLQSAVSLAIDSSVYVLNANGTISQLYQGHKQNFPLRKAPIKTLTAPTKIYTNADLNYLFILEPTTQRVVVFKKDLKNGGAQYQTQYIFGKVGQLRDLVVADNRLYVMDDKKVYFVNLNGL